jgi:hypothetical protein
MKNVGSCALYESFDHTVFSSMDAAQRPVGWDLEVTAVVVKHRAATGCLNVSCVLLYATRLPCSGVE